MIEPGSIPAVPSGVPVRILLADDNEDDRYLFDKVLSSMSIPTQLALVGDCDSLIAYLSDTEEKLPDVLFLDFNMPKMNGAECLIDLQKNKRLENLPIIIYSMFIQKDVADLLYNKGVHYYIRKAGLTELKNDLHHILTLLVENNFTQPTKEKFVLSLEATARN
jgi:CheY-like chemotaxis protein